MFFWLRENVCTECVSRTKHIQHSHHTHTHTHTQHTHTHARVTHSHHCYLYQIHNTATMCNYDNWSRRDTHKRHAHTRVHTYTHASTHTHTHTFRQRTSQVDLTLSQRVDKLWSRRDHINGQPHDAGGCGFLC